MDRDNVSGTEQRVTEAGEKTGVQAELPGWTDQDYFTDRSDGSQAQVHSEQR